MHQIQQYEICRRLRCIRRTGCLSEPAQLFLNNLKIRIIAFIYHFFSVKISFSLDAS